MHIIYGTVPGASRLARIPELSKQARQRLKWLGYYHQRRNNAPPYLPPL